MDLGMDMGINMGIDMEMDMEMAMEKDLDMDMGMNLDLYMEMDMEMAMEKDLDMEMGADLGMEMETENNFMTTNSNALMTYAGRLYTAYMAAAKKQFAELNAPTWADFVCDPLNKTSVSCWVEVAKVAIKLENDARDEAL